MLHIVNKSPFQNTALQSCLRVAQPGHAVLLIEDAVVAASTGTALEAQLRDAATRLRVHVLQPDLEARGLAERRIDSVSPVDYGGFVDLVAEYPTSQSWL